MPFFRRQRTVHPTTLFTALLLAWLTMLSAVPPVALAGGSAAACPGATMPPVAAGSGPLPQGLPSTGGGFGGTSCGSDPEACQSGGPATADSSSDWAQPGAPPPAAVAWRGSSPSLRRPVDLLMLALIPSSGAQIAADPCSPVPSLPSGNGGGPINPGGPSQANVPTPIPCPPLPDPPPLPNARQVALGLAVPYPNVQIGINPAPLGLTGMPSWFWIQGYDGSPFGAGTRIDVPPQVPAGYPAGCPQPPGASLTVATQFIPTGYDWAFGDRLTTSTLSTTSRGQAYPQRSDIRHRYEYTSLGRPDGFPVSVTVHFHARYQANGGPWQALPAIAKTSTRGYPVQQAQSVLVNHP